MWKRIKKGEKRKQGKRRRKKKDKGKKEEYGDGKRRGGEWRKNKEDWRWKKVLRGAISFFLLIAVDSRLSSRVTLRGAPLKGHPRKFPWADWKLPLRLSAATTGGGGKGGSGGGEEGG